MKILRDFGNDVYEVECDLCNRPSIFYKNSCKDGVVQCLSCSRHQHWDEIEKFNDDKKLDDFIAHVRQAHSPDNITGEEQK